MTPAAPWNVVLLGDTRDLHHHGCEAVIRSLERGLADQGIPATSVVPGLSWNDRAREMMAADLVVINGEGSLHHDRPAVESVLALAVARRENGRPTALVNASWFANHDKHTRCLAFFDVLSLRDPQSRALVRALGIDCHDATDLAVGEASRLRACQAGATARVRITDSTQPEVTLRLLRASRRQGWIYSPMLYPPSQARPSAKSRKIIRKTRIARLLGPLAPWLVSPRYHAHATGNPSLDGYLRSLKESGGVLTGRFHAVCFCLGLGVPFRAVSSNTPKIESLLEDVGLDPARRLLHPDQLDAIADIPPWTDGEIRSIEAFLQRAQAQEQRLFGAIRALLPDPPAIQA